MFSGMLHEDLLTVLTAITGLVIVSAVWLFLVMRHTRAARINLRAMGVSVDIDMTRERRAGGGDSHGTQNHFPETKE